jgi:NAD+ synthase (glutamine-hydrolysing)
MKIAIAQIDPKVGSFRENARKILDSYERACLAQARLLLTPELSVCGYPPGDWLERPEFVDSCEAVCEELRAATVGKGCALAVGSVVRNPSLTGRPFQNVLRIFEEGREVHRQVKVLLPQGDLFEEPRHFEAGEALGVWNVGSLGVPEKESLSSLGPSFGLPLGPRIGFGICEDFWFGRPTGFLGVPGVPEGESSRTVYPANPVSVLGSKKPSFLISQSASPYEWGKQTIREAVHAEVARAGGVPLVYVNCVGARDELLFDGGSFACDSQGQILFQLPRFETAVALIEWDPERGLKLLSSNLLLAEGDPQSLGKKESKAVQETEISVLKKGLVRGIRDYFAASGAERAVVGLSGGIDSAVVAALAVEALGASRVLGVAMPSQYSSSHSLADAEALARALRCRFVVKPIKFLFAQANREIGEGKPGGLVSIAQENLQARLRGLILMTLANDEGALVLTTGNKSELATGYCTLYGDMCGALGPLGDVLKTRVYELAREINRSGNRIIPESTLTKAPSAELRPDQKDQDSLPPYDELDAVLVEYLERQCSIVEIESRRVASGKDASWVRDVLRRVERNEFKRRQAAPVLRVSPKAFGLGRRVPVNGGDFAL